MAEPVRNNPLLPAVSPFVPQTAPEAAATPIAPSVQADTTDTTRARSAAGAISGGIPGGIPGGIGIVPPSQTSAPIVPQSGSTQTRTEPTPGTGVRLEGVAVADANRAVSESQRVLKRFTGTGIGATRHTFKPAVVFRDQQGEVHVRMQRMYNNIPVFGEQVITHFDKSNNVTDVTDGETPEGLSPDTRATLSKDDAKATALAAFGKTPQSQTEPELVIVKGDDGKYKLAYHLILTNLTGNEPRRMHYFVDAQKNGVVAEYNEIHGIVPEFRQPAARAPGSPVVNTQPATSNGWRVPAWPWPFPTIPGPKPKPGLASGTGNSIYLGNVKLDTTRQADGSYLLRDPKHRNGETRDQHNNDAGGIGEDGFPSVSTALTDNNNRWGETSDPERTKPAVDAQYIAGKYDSYLKDMFGRSGIDNNGVPGRSVVHTNVDMVNAFYYNGVMWYGDGDGVTAGPLVDKDVASHEPTHGLTEHTSGLIYRGESGALNEAASDIIGSAGFSWYLRGRKDQGIASDYTIGEDCWTPGKDGDALRYMNDPTRDRDGSSPYYSRDNYADLYRGWGDNGGVHLNSGIANNFFYLIANGGTNRTSGMHVDGLGMEKALKIFYRAATVYFTPSTDFAGARLASIKAAEDLYGKDSLEARTTNQGWAAVGVAPAAPAPDAPAPASAAVSLAR